MSYQDIRFAVEVYLAGKAKVTTREVMEAVGGKSRQVSNAIKSFGWVPQRMRPSKGLPICTVYCRPAATKAEDPTTGWNGWQCGDAADRSGLLLFLIEQNRIADVHAMRFLEDAIYEAGPGHCRQLLQHLERGADVPF